MAAFIKVLGLVLSLAFIAEGFRCNPGIVISQQKLSGTVNGQQVWNATVENTCDCVQLHVSLSIPNFDSVTKVNTTVISKSHDDIYDVNGGLPIYPHTGVFFTYAGQNLNITTNDRTEACD
ncbi:uncharacterized protein LOC107796499 [Nicotiana tabacum]|uniref:Uncharacterized protein LOC107796499 n=2 Tax=Nicotiana TaxID=4085 RepID=A0A1S4AE80_TOBAC|nr:PREDICTED: uncharacterized protein LOC104228179 [Nicotiana sylvestris]XP_016474773.1 PREDICTED: uncharacterized protein LOC107796499 [Nicotiana tabacum]